MCLRCSGGVQEGVAKQVKTILFVVNVDWFFISHRLVLAKKAKELGYRVLVLGADTGRAREITAEGIDFIPMSIDRSGTNPIKEITTLYTYFKAFKK